MTTQTFHQGTTTANALDEIIRWLSRQSTAQGQTSPADGPAKSDFWEGTTGRHPKGFRAAQTASFMEKQ